jgi:hypothetical protein
MPMNLEEDQMDQESYFQLMLEGLTPQVQVGNLNAFEIYATQRDILGKRSMLKLKDISEADIKSFPIFYSIVQLMEIAQNTGPIPLFGKENELNNDLVQFLMPSLPFNPVETPSLERDLPKWNELFTSLATMSGFFKIIDNKLTLTPKASFHLSQKNYKILFQRLFVTHARKFNLGYFDHYALDYVGNSENGMLIFLLFCYGNEPKPFKFFYQKFSKLYPFLESEKFLQGLHPGVGFRAWHKRICVHLLRLWGLLELHPNEGNEKRRISISSVGKNFILVKN